MVKAMAKLWFIRSRNTIAVQGARPQSRHVTMPDLIGVFGKHQSLNFALTRGIEQAQFNFFGMSGEQRKIDAFAVPGCTEWIGFAWPYASAR